MENQLGKNMENEMKTPGPFEGNIYWHIGSGTVASEPKEAYLET